MQTDHVVVLTGGVGGAKLALGLSELTNIGRLTAIVNTGDDFEHLGLPICPDLDTLMYTLAGEVNPETGWGRRDESWQFMAALQALGGETWFQLGDRDLATHLRRSDLLAAGMRLTEVTQQLCAVWDIKARVLPMTDDPVRTRVVTDRGERAFQHYFVRDRAEPAVSALYYAGAEHSAVTAEVRAALDDPGLTAIVIAPSNPYLSIDPILAVPALRDMLSNAPAPVVAVSPIIAGGAVKGPAAKIMAELGVEPAASAVAEHYGKLLDGFICDERDRKMVAETDTLDVPVRFCDTIMQTLADKISVAGETLEFARSLEPGRD